MIQRMSNQNLQIFVMMKYFGACMSCDCGEYLNAETRKCCKYNVLVSSDSVCDSYSDKEINGLAEIIMGKPDKK